MSIDCTNDDFLRDTLKAHLDLCDVTVNDLTKENPNYRQAMYHLGTLRESVRALLMDLSQDEEDL